MMSDDWGRAVALGFCAPMVKTYVVNLVLSSFRALAAASLWLGVSLGFASVAQASVLYRCLDQGGITAYTSSTVGYSNCKMLGNFPAERGKPAASITSAASVGADPGPSKSTGVEFRTAPGEAAPKAVTSAGTATPKVTRGAVYKYERNGVTHYTNRRPAGQSAQVLFSYIETCFACGAAPGLDFNNVGLNLTAYAAEIAAAAARHGVEEALVRAVIHAESAFNPNAISRAGAQGLMQLMPATASRFGITDIFVPSENIEGGVSYLAWLSQRFNGDLTRIAAGYNAGEGAVDRYGGVPPYQETMIYVERVGILRERYQKELTPKSVPVAIEVAATLPGGV